MNRKTRLLLGSSAATLALGASLIGCAVPTPLTSGRSVERSPGKAVSEPPGEAVRNPPATAIPSGIPLPRLSDAQLAAFERGKVLFDHEFQPGEDVGPLFNAPSCVACHIDGGIGGTGSIIEARVGVVDDRTKLAHSTGFYDLHELGGPVLQFRDLAFGFPGGGNGANSEQPPGPADIATLAALKQSQGVHIGQQVVVSLRGTTQVAGNGLMTAIPDEDLFEREAENRKQKPFGITGHVNRLSGNLGDLNLNGRTGRLGWKAQLPDNLAFLVDASVEELGLSNPHDPINNVRNSPADHDPNPDLSDQQVKDIEAFCALMAGPTPAYLDTKGLAAFKKAGCAVCHWPSYETASKRSELHPNLQPFFNALGNQKVEAYTDLLVHQMGEGLADGFVQGSANGGEWRTPPLWGLRFREQLPPVVNAFYMHDRASLTLEDAIRRHQSPGSEANEVIDNYKGVSTRHPQNNLSPSERAALLNFLKGL